MLEDCKNAGYSLNDEGYLFCNSCGSMNPEEFIHLIKEGKAVLKEVEWDNGYPYLFEVELPNKNAGQIKQVGVRYYIENGVSKEEPIMTRIPKHTFHKFYSHHLALTDIQVFNEIALYINKVTGVRFDINEKGIYYTKLFMPINSN